MSNVCVYTMLQALRTNSILLFTTLTILLLYDILASNNC